VDTTTILRLPTLDLRSGAKKAIDAKDWSAAIKSLFFRRPCATPQRGI